VRLTPVLLRIHAAAEAPRKKEEEREKESGEQEKVEKEKEGCRVKRVSCCTSETQDLDSS
jgi:hypothetical protein